MLHLIPYLNLKKSETHFNFFKDPFGSDLFYNKKEGLHMVGGGLAPLYFCFSNSAALFDKKLFPSHNYKEFMIELDLYATPESLDFPEIRFAENGILAKYGLMDLSWNWLRDAASFYGQASAFEAWLFALKIKRNINSDEILNNDVNRSNLGLIVLEEYESRGKGNPAALQELLLTYKPKIKKESAKIIPFLPRCKTSTLDLSEAKPQTSYF